MMELWGCIILKEFRTAALGWCMMAFWETFDGRIPRLK